jgi:hypothetical protein
LIRAYDQAVRELDEGDDAGCEAYGSDGVHAEPKGSNDVVQALELEVLNTSCVHETDQHHQATLV